MIYAIEFINGYISIYNDIDNEFELLKYKGEISQKFEESKFWNWFEDKISYDDEALSFIIITDNEEFKIPTNFKLNNDFKLNRDLREFIDIKLKNYNLITYPTIKIELEPQKTDTPKPIKKIKKGSINEYYINQTKLYKNL